MINKDLGISFFYISEIFVNEVFVEWDYYVAKGRNLSEFSIVLQRSYNPEFHFLDASATYAADAFKSFTDDDVDLLSNWESLYYRLKVTDTIKNEIYYTNSFTFFSEPDFELMEIRRLNELLLKNYITPKTRWGKVNTVIFLRRQSGEHCSVCWDSVLNKVSDSRCETCFGTGWEVGFDGPIFRPINIVSPSKQQQINEFGKEEIQMAQAWMSFNPPVKPRDVIIELNTNQRWRIVDKSGTQKNRQDSRQILNLVKINRDDVEYKIETPILKRSVKFYEDLPSEDEVKTNEYYRVSQDGNSEYPLNSSYGSEGIYTVKEEVWVKVY